MFILSFLLLTMSGISNLLAEMAEDTGALTGIILSQSPTQTFLTVGSNHWPPALDDLFSEFQDAEPDRDENLRRQRPRVYVTNGRGDSEEETDTCVPIDWLAIVDPPDEEVAFKTTVIVLESDFN